MLERTGVSVLHCIVVESAVMFCTLIHVKLRELMMLDEEVLIEPDEETVLLEANDDREEALVTLDDTVVDDEASEGADSMGREDEECSVGNARAELPVRS